MIDSTYVVDVCHPAKHEDRVDKELASPRSAVQCQKLSAENRSIMSLTISKTEQGPVRRRSNPKNRLVDLKPPPAAPHASPGRSADHGRLPARNASNVSYGFLHEAGTHALAAVVDTAGPAIGIATEPKAFTALVTGACYHARHELCSDCGCSCHPSLTRL